MVNFLYDNGYENDAGETNTHNAQGGEENRVLRKMSGMFETIKNLKNIFSDERVQAQNNDGTEEEVVEESDAETLPWGRFTTTKTVGLPGYGELTGCISLSFDVKGECTFKVKCYEPGTLDRQIYTQTESSNLIHKCGSYPSTPYEIRCGGFIFIKELQEGIRQGSMEMGCRLRSIHWNKNIKLENGDEVHQMEVDVGNCYLEAVEQNVNCAPELLQELFKEPFTLNSGVCDEITRFNEWIVQTNENATYWQRTERFSP